MRCKPLMTFFISLKYQRSPTSSFNDLGIGKLGFVIIAHLICRSIAQSRKKSNCCHLKGIFIFRNVWKSDENSVWVPFRVDVYIREVTRILLQVINVLSKLAGLWIDTSGKVMYSQATHITFICPMRFDKFPLDTQRCKFKVGGVYLGFWQDPCLLPIPENRAVH